MGHRVPSALGWAIRDGAQQWVPNFLQGLILAEVEMDAGPIWASASLTLRPVTKSSQPRNEVP